MEMYTNSIQFITINHYQVRFLKKVKKKAFSNNLKWLQVRMCFSLKH